MTTHLFFAAVYALPVASLATLMTDGKGVADLGVVGVLGVCVIVLAKYVAKKDEAANAASLAHHTEREKHAEAVLSLAREAVSEISSNRARGEAVLTALHTINENLSRMNQKCHADVLREEGNDRLKAMRNDQLHTR